MSLASFSILETQTLVLSLNRSERPVTDEGITRDVDFGESVPPVPDESVPPVSAKVYQ